MSNPENGIGENAATQQEILDQAKKRYGEGAHFVYLKSDSVIAMTLEEAMQICGDYIVKAKENELWTILDQWHRSAELLKQRSEEHFNRSLELGKQALSEALKKKEVASE
jgi:hypothetical protein